MRAFDTIIFDFGGVLIDWNPRYVFRQIFDTEKEIDWFLENICDMAWNEEQDAGRSLEEATAIKLIEYPEHAQAILAYYGRWEEMLGGPIQTSVDILTSLKDSNQYRLYGLTNWSEETFPFARERFDFLNIFDGIVVSGVEKTRKPFPKIYNLLLDRYEVDAEKAVFIDDNLRNVNAARGLGIEGIHFESSDQLKNDLSDLKIL